MQTVIDNLEHDRETAIELLSSCERLATAVCGVPCSTLWPWLLHVPALLTRARIAANEGEAVAYAAGAWLGGGAGVALMQSSGIGNAINAFTSLLETCRIPVIALIGWRGTPGTVDEPHHRSMGVAAAEMLRLCSLHPVDIREARTAPQDAVKQIQQRFENGIGSALLFPNASHRSKPDLSQGVGGRQITDLPGIDIRLNVNVPKPHEVLEICREEISYETPIIGSTGFCCRELYALGDQPNYFYMTGSMGHAGSVGLGVAEQIGRHTVVLDGDGALLMRLGTLAMIGSNPSAKLVHIVLRNEMHESTGGQRTAARPALSFAALAQECGYSFVAQCSDPQDFREVLRHALKLRSPSFIEVRTGSRPPSKLPRIPDCLPDLTRRFREHISAVPAAQTAAG